MKKSLRFANSNDCGLILEFIKGIAEYEKLAHMVEATEEILQEWIFAKGAAEVIFACVDDREIGFAVFCKNFSTFTGRAGLYLEDIFVLPEYRGLGFGKMMFNELAKIAVERGYGRMDWVCLDWNKPSIDFYKQLNAEPLDEWTIWRLDEEKLRNFKV